MQLALLLPSQIVQCLGAIEQNIFEITGGSRGISFLEFHNRMTISSEIQEILELSELDAESSALFSIVSWCEVS